MDGWRWDKWQYDQKLKTSFEAHLAAGGDLNDFVPGDYDCHETFGKEARNNTDYNPQWSLDQIKTLIKVAVVAATKDSTQAGLGMLERFLPKLAQVVGPTVGDVARGVRTARGDQGEPPDVACCQEGQETPE
jgi:hypothetical protein